MAETSCSYCGGADLYFSSDERRWINKIRKLKEAYPDQVTIIAEPEANDGCIYCKLPVDWLKLKPPVKRNMTEKQREEARERMMKARENLA